MVLKWTFMFFIMDYFSDFDKTCVTSVLLYSIILCGFHSLHFVSKPRLLKFRNVFLGINIHLKGKYCE
jgi:hypothetical protein